MILQSLSLSLFPEEVFSLAQIFLTAIAYANQEIKALQEAHKQANRFQLLMADLHARIT